MKNQVDIINIAGAVISASLIVFSNFMPSLSAFSNVKRIRIPQTQKLHFPQKQQNLRSNKKIFASTLAPTEISTRVNHKKTSPKQIAPLDEEKPECQSSQLEDECEEPSESNGCPKNLDYFTMRPRPKQMPEECMTCEKLITCACLTGN